MKKTRVGHLDQNSGKITPLAYASGSPITNLYEVLEVGADTLKPASTPVDRSAVKILPPISGRDVLAVGKNYTEHAKEFNVSGYDSSDKVDMPSHLVIFTKRATSIIADGEDILPHSEFTQALDYEGEVGVIIGKSGFGVSEADAEDYVWGYTIVNDVTAREKQRDHKQFYIGKSADGFCPMGPIAVPKEALPKVLKVQTRVNGELRQQGTTDDLIFSVKTLIKTLSESQTLQPGDVIATGTPAGVGFGLKPPVFLKPGDVVEISVTGLGTLKNKIGEPGSKNATLERASQLSRVPFNNLDISLGGIGLVQVGHKKLNVRTVGTGGDPVVFVHGLGGTTTYYNPLISAAKLSDHHRCILYDLEGHGLSPTRATSVVTIQSLADDLANIFAHPDFKIHSATVIAHSMGCLVAETFATQHPQLVNKLILIGPPPSPLPTAAQDGTKKRAETVRKGGMRAVADGIVEAGTSAKSKAERPLAVAAALQSLLSQDPEGYAKCCTALAGTTEEIKVEDIKCPVLLVTGDEDKVSPPAHVEKLGKRMSAKTAVLPGVGHWHGFEDVTGLAEVVSAFLK